MIALHRRSKPCSTENKRLAARKLLLHKKKEFTRLRDELSCSFLMDHAGGLIAVANPTMAIGSHGRSRGDVAKS